ncbi:MAG: hypothetical protein ACOC46_02985 [Pirellulales bacterium]
MHKTPTAGHAPADFRYSSPESPNWKNPNAMPSPGRTERQGGQRRDKPRPSDAQSAFPARPWPASLVEQPAGLLQSSAARALSQTGEKAESSALGEAEREMGIFRRQAPGIAAKGTLQFREQRTDGKEPIYPTAWESATCEDGRR